MEVSCKHRTERVVVEETTYRLGASQGVPGADDYFEDWEDLPREVRFRLRKALLRTPVEYRCGDCEHFPPSVNLYAVDCEQAGRTTTHRENLPGECELFELRHELKHEK